MDKRQEGIRLAMAMGKGQGISKQGTRNKHKGKEKEQGLRGCHSSSFIESIDFFGSLWTRAWLLEVCPVAFFAARPQVCSILLMSLLSSAPLDFTYVLSLSEVRGEERERFVLSQTNHPH